MKKFVLFATLLLATASVSMSGYDAARTQEVTTVYVCTGGYATKYHSSYDCRGLSNCKGDVVSMSESDAIKKGRSRCKICF